MKQASDEGSHVSETPVNPGVPGFLPPNQTPPQLQSGGIAVAVIMSLAVLIKAATGFVKAIK